MFVCVFCFFFCLSEVMNECLAFSELDRRSKGWGGGGGGGAGLKPWLGWCVVFLPSECLSPSRSKDGYKENS